MRILRIVAILAVMGFLLYGLASESRAVASLDGKATTQVNGSGFIRGATSDRYLRLDGKLLDKKSSVAGGEEATVDDCPT